jgi:hypothetical protein
MGGQKKLDPIEARLRREKADVTFLLKQPQFLRFLWRVIQASRIFTTAQTDGSEGAVHAEVARRNLGLAILEMVEAGQPAASPTGEPILTLIQTLREEANPPPSERDDETRTNDARYDRNAELDDEPDE